MKELTSHIKSVCLDSTCAVYASSLWGALCEYSKLYHVQQEWSSKSIKHSLCPQSLVKSPYMFKSDTGMDAEGLLHTHILSKRVSCSVGWSGIPVYRRITLRPPFSTSQVKGASTHLWLQKSCFFLFQDSKSLTTHSFVQS